MPSILLKENGLDLEQDLMNIKEKGVHEQQPIGATAKDFNRWSKYGVGRRKLQCGTCFSKSKHYPLF